MRNQQIKQDNGKLRMELIPPETLKALAEVLTYGANKYSANSWQQVEPQRYLGALLRHLVEYVKDNNSIDDESGIKHIDHVLCNACFLGWFVNGNNSDTTNWVGIAIQQEMEIKRLNEHIKRLEKI